MSKLCLLLFLVLSFINPQTALPAAPLSFGNARKIMQKASNALEAANADTEAKKNTADSLKTLWGPTISAQATEIWGESTISINRSIATPLGTMPVDIDEQKNFSGPRASVTGTWHLFTGGKILAEQRAAKYSVDEAKARERAVGVEQDVKLIGLYFGLQLAAAIERIRREMLTQQEKELARAKEFEATGMISKVERMSVQVARDKSERQWLKARDDKRIAKIQLASMLRSDSFGELSTPLFVISSGLAPAREWVRQTIDHNPQIAMLEAQVKKADQGVAAAKGAFSPDIFAFGQYSFIRHYQTMIEPNWIAGVGINLTLWDARGRVGSYRSAKATSRQARAMRQDIVNQAAADAETAWQNTQNALDRYRLTAGNAELAKENMDLKIRGFEEGLNTALDMTDARVQLAEAQVDRKLAAYEFVVNYAILHAIAGRMDDFLKAASAKSILAEK